MSKNKPAQKKSFLPFIIIGVVLAILVVGATLMFRSSDNTGDVSATKPLTTAPNPGLPGAQPMHVKGEASAALTIEEFGDYQCPPCGNLHPVLQKIEDDYGSRVRVIFRNFPLTMHRNAFTAARAAEAAMAQDKYWPMHDIIYENQKEWSESPEPHPIFQDYARRLDLDVERFKTDMEKSETAARIVADQRRGISLGVQGTPTLLLNGRELTAEKTLDPVKLRAEIDATLAGKTQ